MSMTSGAAAALEIARAYRALFLGEDGRLLPEAETVMRDLERECGWMVDRMPVAPDGHVDPLRLAGSFEKRRTYAHIKKRLFEPLEKYQQRATEKE